MENVLFSFLPCMLLLRSPYISGVAKPLHAEKLLWTYTNKSQDTTALLFVPREALNKSREAKQRSRGLQVIAALILSFRQTAEDHTKAPLISPKAQPATETTLRTQCD